MCSFGYTVLEPLYEGSDGACDGTDDFGVKGFKDKDGKLVLRFSEDGGATFYNQDQPRLAVPF